MSRRGGEARRGSPRRTCPVAATAMLKRARSHHTSGPRIGCGRSWPSASRRSSGLVRSRIRTPSRWSSSCWMTRASSPSASTVTALPVGSRRLDGHRRRALDGHDHRGRAEREAALVHGFLVLGARDELRVDERATGLLVVGLVDEHAAENADLRRGEADAAGLLHQTRSSARRGRRRSRRTRRPRRRRIRSTGSGYWRICASAARRRASRSASSSSLRTWPSTSPTRRSL